MNSKSWDYLTLKHGLHQTSNKISTHFCCISFWFIIFAIEKKLIIKKNNNNKIPTKPTYQSSSPFEVSFRWPLWLGHLNLEWWWRYLPRTALFWWYLGPRRWKLGGGWYRHQGRVSRMWCLVVLWSVYIYELLLNVNLLNCKLFPLNNLLLKFKRLLWKGVFRWWRFECYYLDGGTGSQVVIFLGVAKTCRTNFPIFGDFIDQFLKSGCNTTQLYGTPL